MFSFMNPGKSKPAKKGLKIIIVGCGKVGTTLVEQLSKEGHDIIIIDKNAKKVQEIANIYDIMGIVGNGASYSVQMVYGIFSVPSSIVGFASFRWMQELKIRILSSL